MSVSSNSSSVRKIQVFKELACCWQGAGQTKVIEIQCISDRILFLKLIIDKVVFTFLSVYAPQANLPGADKERFYDQLQCSVAKVSATEILIPVSVWNGQVGAAAGVFIYAHGRQGFDTCTAPEGERVLEFAIANGLPVGNAWFKKRDSHLVIYGSGG